MYIKDLYHLYILIHTSAVFIILLSSCGRDDELNYNFYNSEFHDNNTKGELIKREWKLTSINGVSGYAVMGNNGTSIFLYAKGQGAVITTYALNSDGRNLFPSSVNDDKSMYA